MKSKTLIAIFAVLAALALQGCAGGPERITKQECFPLMYEEDPASILILPPMNNSTAADAKEYYTTTIQVPLSFNGFYTFPVPVTNEILQMEGIYDTELLYGLPLHKFREYFGADAVLFTTIDKWDTSYMVLASTLTVAFTAEIKSTTSDQTLWKYKGQVVIDLSGGNTGGGLAGLIAKAVVAAVNTAAADYVPYAQRANFIMFSSLPAGKYNAWHQKDQTFQIINRHTMPAKAAEGTEAAPTAAVSEAPATPTSQADSATFN